MRQQHGHPRTTQRHPKPSPQSRPISSPNQRASPPKTWTQINYINNVNQIQINNIGQSITYNVDTHRSVYGKKKEGSRHLIRSEQFKKYRDSPRIDKQIVK